MRRFSVSSIAVLVLARSRSPRRVPERTCLTIPRFEFLTLVMTQSRIDRNCYGVGMQPRLTTRRYLELTSWPPMNNSALRSLVHRPDDAQEFWGYSVACEHVKHHGSVQAGGSLFEVNELQDRSIDLTVFFLTCISYTT